MPDWTVTDWICAVGGAYLACFCFVCYVQQIGRRLTQRRSEASGEGRL